MTLELAIVRSWWQCLGLLDHWEPIVLLMKIIKETHMTQSGAPGHYGGFVDGHGIFGIVSDDGMARLVVRGDDFVFLVDLCTSSLRACLTQKYI